MLRFCVFYCFFFSLFLSITIKVVLAIVIYLWCWNKISQLVGSTQVNNNDYYKKYDREHTTFFIIQVYVCCESTNSVLYWTAKSAWSLSKRKAKKQFITVATYISHDLLFESWLVHFFEWGTMVLNFWLQDRYYYWLCNR